MRDRLESSARRALLVRGLAAATGLAFAPRARRSLAADAPGVVPVGDGFTLVTGLGGNVLVRATRAGSVLVDSGAPGSTEALRAVLAELPGGPRAHTLVNTHWHSDQVGGNASFGADGTHIVAHEKTRLRLATPYYIGPEERYEPPLPAAGRPTESFHTRGESRVGGADVEYGHLLLAHTDGDIYVRFGDANLVAVGDVVSPVRDPVLDWFGGGWLGGRVDSLARLLEITDAETRFVPSYGPVVGRAEVEAEHALMLHMYDYMLEYVRKGYSAGDMLAEGVMDRLDRRFDDPFAFLYDAHKGMWAHHNTLSPDIV